MKEPRAGTRKVNGKLLRKLREDRGWPVRELAERSGYSERNIERMEAGEPSKFETIRDVAQALGDGVSFETLLDSYEPSKALEGTIEKESESGGVSVITSERYVVDLRYGVSPEDAIRKLTARFARSLNIADEIHITILRESE